MMQSSTSFSCALWSPYKKKLPMQHLYSWNSIHVFKTPNFRRGFGKDKMFDCYLFSLHTEVVLLFNFLLHMILICPIFTG
jgi:hypothetical protein